MAQFEYTVTTAAPAASGFYWDCLATTSDVYLRELHIFSVAGTLSEIKLFRTTAAGTRTTPVVPTAAQCALSGTGNAPLAGFATAWSVNPTPATNAMRSTKIAASVGAGIIWTWYGPEGGLRIPAAASVCLQNGATLAGTVDVTAIWTE